MKSNTVLHVRALYIYYVKIQQILIKGGFKKSHETYFSLWYCFMLFQQEIQVIAITVFKNCTEPKDIHKTTQ